MFDLTTLTLLAGLFFAAIAGEAVLYSDTLYLRVNVPDSLQKKGFSELFAEETFTSEAARIVGGHSIIPAPDMRVHSRPTMATAIAQPLRLEHVVRLLQENFGIKTLSVTAAIIEREAKPDDKPAAGKTPSLEMALIIFDAEQENGPEQVRITQENGDPVALVQHGAQWSMERIVPYRVTLAHFLAGVQGDASGFVAARETAMRALDRTLGQDDGSKRAMLYNVLANIAIIENNLPGAVQAYALADQIPGVVPQVRAEMGLNRALVAVALKQPGQAAAILQQAKLASPHLDLPGFDTNLRLIEGLVAWANGDLTTAEKIFRGVVADEPLNEAGHYYLGKILAVRGDNDGSAGELSFALATRSTEPPTQGLVIRLFWIDPVSGTTTKRF